jgi:(S)-ureidoglycine aminohydrolase
LHHLGATRSSLKKDHLLQTPDTFIRTPLPGAAGTEFVIHIAPQRGAAFTQMTAEFAEGGTLGPTPAQRFVYVIEGELELTADGSQLLAFSSQQMVGRGGFFYIPQGTKHTVRARTKARAAVIEKIYQSEDGAPAPQVVVGKETEIRPSALMGDESLRVCALMPDGPEYDFAVNTMTYDPGAALSMVEIHIMEHGLLMLEGGGIYKLSDSWYPVEAGDFIWMAPYCPQWFGALGKRPAKYLIYKDWRRHPLAPETSL